MARRNLVLVSLFYLVVLIKVSSSDHSHPRDLNKEREDDGSFKPRDANHLSGGEHHVDFDHEAILGSAKKAEEFDTLPPEEAKKRLAILITKMDFNHDNHIDRNELKAWIIRSFKLLSEEDAKERFEDVDRNADGRTSWDEYVMETYNLEYKTQVTEDLEEMQFIADDKEMFEVADANRDGFLDESEFIIFSHPEENPVMIPVLLRQALRNKDTNKDGYIDFQEYLEDRGFEKDKEWVLSEKDKFDQDYDTNKDGRLDSEEILSWIIPSNVEIAEDEVVHLFASSDDDHDNTLSFKEIIDHYDIFVGSEATDYGEQLHKLEHDEL